jgi:Ca2+-binding EF-hand superfamily protein
MEEILEECAQKFDEHDKDGSGEISFDEFVYLYRDIEDDQSRTEEEARVVFDGIDINNDKSLSKKEFLDLVKAMKTNDTLFLYKMSFRSFDPDRSRSLEADEIVTYFNFCGRKTNKKQAERLIAKENPGGDSLTFAQLYSKLTGEEIDPDTDPYDGQIPWTKEEQVVSRSVDIDLEEESSKLALSASVETILEKCGNKFDELDSRKTRFLDFGSFLKLYRILEGDPKRSAEEANVVFGGVDTNNDRLISKEEFINLVKIFITNDKLGKYKLFFRSFDSNRSRTLSVNDVIKYYKFCKWPISHQDAEKQVLEENSQKIIAPLSFAQFYHMLTSQIIDPDTDPYDGQIP